MTRSPKLALLVVALLLASCGDEPVPVFEVPDWAQVAPEQIAEAERHRVPVAFENDLGMRFVLIPSGTFWMGSPETEEGRRDDETQREVTITRPYYMQIREMRNEAFHANEALVEPDITSDRREDCATDRNHFRATAFAERLSRFDPARAYRLPSEAEWECACRAGTETAYWWGDSQAEAGWRAGAIVDEGPVDPADPAGAPPPGERASTVSEEDRTPNGWGLYAMSGGSREWCADFYGPYAPGPVRDPRGPSSGTHRVVRGAQFRSEPRHMRSAARDWAEPDDSSYGFRLVSPLP